MKRLVAGGLAFAAALLVAVVWSWASGHSVARAAPSTSASKKAAQRRKQEQITKQLNNAVATIEKLNIPGGVIGVTGDTVGRYQRAFGLAAAGQRMTLNDEFRIGSVTKTFTATVILELVDRGQLKLNQSIYKWEPRLPYAKLITISNLLNMTSGIWDQGGPGSLLSAWIGQNCFLDTPSPNCGRYWSPQQIVNLAIKQGAAYPPGIWNYSDTNYVLLALIAERVTHKPFWLLLNQLLFSPLHLHHTFFPTSSLSVPKPATVGYVPVVSKKTMQLLKYVPGPVPNPSVLYGAGAVISTLGDLQVWAKALATGALLKPQTQRLRLQLFQAGIVFQPLANTGVTTGLVTNYGLGLADAGGMLGHNGVIYPPGETAEMWYLPSQHGSVVVLLNSYTACSAGTLADAASASLAKLAFGSSLSRVGAPPVQCPVSRSGAGISARSPAGSQPPDRTAPPARGRR